MSTPLVHAAEPTVDYDAMIHAFLAAAPGSRELHQDRLVKQGERGVPGIVAALEKCDAKDKVQLLYALQRLGPKAKVAVPAMIRLAQSDPAGSVRSEAVNSLASAQDAEAIPVLIRALDSDKDADVRVRCLFALGAFGPRAKEAAPRLVALLADREMLNGASYAIQRIGKDAVPPLVDQLGSRDRRVRFLTASTLEGMGPDARAATADLIRVLADEDESVRVFAVRALGAVATKEPATLRALRGVMDKDRPQVRIEAAISIWLLGHEDEKVAEFIAASARDKDYVVQHTALFAIAAMKRCPPVCLKAVEAVLLGDKSDEFRVAAACTLAELGRQAKPSLPALYRALKDDDRSVRTAASDAIEEIEAALERP